VRQGYLFAGWSTDPAAATVTHAAGSALTLTSPLVLYAVWRPGPTYTVSYAAGAQNVSGLPADAAGLAAGAAYTVPASSPVRTGYSFAGWSSSTGATLQPGAGFTMPEADVVLTATWAAATAATSTATEAGAAAGPATGPAPPRFDTSQVKGLDAAGIGLLDAQTGAVLADIAAGNVPLGGLAASGVRSLTSLALGLLAALVALALLIGRLTQRRRGSVRPQGARALAADILCAAALALGVATAIAFVLTDDASQAAVWVNSATPVVVALFAAQLAALAAYQVAYHTGKGARLLDEALDGLEAGL
jgi:uncharacterized repeat protein (TIGR02543 family)